MKAVSVVIPCYNAVACIDRCLQSIVNQTIGIENLEVILVNDASTDKTLDKLCEWEARFPESVIVINCEENGKQGCARNIGMQYAAGEYIGFADDDDILEDAMFEVLYKAAISNQCDIAVCQSVKHDIETSYDIGTGAFQEEVILIQSEEDRLEFLNREINIAIWNKIYKREFLLDNQIDFLPGYIYDDIFFSALVKQYCKSAYLTNRILYHHIISDTSVSYCTKNKLERIGFLEVHMKLIEELRNRGIYGTFSEWYEKEFMIDYVSFVVNYTKLFGKMEEELACIIKENVVKLFPFFKEIPIVKKMLLSEKDTIYRRIFQELEEFSQTMG